MGIDAQPRPFTTPAETLAQDPTNYVEGLPLVQVIGAPKTLAVLPVLDSYTIVLNAGHLLTGNEMLYITWLIGLETHFLFAKVLSVATNTITLDTPINVAYPIATTYIASVLINMNVDWSVTRQSFSASIPSTSELRLDLMSLRFIIADDVVMDDGKFWWLTTLTRWVILRKWTSEWDRHMNWNMKVNWDFWLYFNNKIYTDKWWGGWTYTVESTLKFREDFGAVCRLSAGEKLEIIIQDNLTWLVAFKCFASFHIVS